MANTLITFNAGDAITAEETNANNQYLENLNTTTAQQLQSYVAREVEKLKAEISGSIMPVGAILPFPIDNIPPGYLVCDGTSYLRTEYEDLFNLIGTVYGAVDDYHFNVPDFRNLVLRGMGSKTASLGLVQEGGVPNIRGWAGGSEGGVSGPFYASGSTGGPSGGAKGSDPHIYFNAARASSVYKDGLDEVRMTNVAVIYAIKY